MNKRYGLHNILNHKEGRNKNDKEKHFILDDLGLIIHTDRYLRLDSGRRLRPTDLVCYCTNSCSCLGIYRIHQSKKRVGTR